MDYIDPFSSSPLASMSCSCAMATSTFTLMQGIQTHRCAFTRAQCMWIDAFVSFVDVY